MATPRNPDIGPLRSCPFGLVLLPSACLSPHMVSAAPSTPFRLLLVEDDPTNALALREMVNGGRIASFKVVAYAETLAQALEVVKREQVDIVLLDLSLPDSQ